jgi:hypothetical protein
MILVRKERIEKMAKISNWFRKPVSCTLYYPGADYPVCGLSVHDRNLLMGNDVC